MTRGMKIFGCAAVGCGLLVVGVAVAVLGGLSWISSDPGDIEVKVEAPLRVAPDARFDLVATVTNTGSSARTLVDVDIAKSYLEGLVVEASQPPFSDAMHVPIDETVSHSFDQRIEPGQQARIVFTMFAAHSGDFSGDLDFCIDSELRCLSYPVRTLVGP